MERGARIASMTLAETILSLDRVYRVDDILSASPILLQADRSSEGGRATMTSSV
ncbi:hypothetical protein JCGZ_12943 [Jatropha curcas]|uniref:Uncharacterized protein n=1 Tax=Jatropha curcas TaxID=180498 RepID=A0A067LNL5_JATCU|nr:hypothetical protein JCGZ_12943 [Jatropha curcas]